MKTLDKVALFWDVDKATLDIKEHANFIIDRILAYGDLDDVAWARKTFGDEALTRRTATSRVLNNKSRSFWCLYYHLDKNICTPKFLKQGQSPFLSR